MSDFNKHADMPATTRATNATLAVADQGVVQDVTTDGVALTLPAAAAGLTFTIRHKGLMVGSTPGAVSAKRVGFTVVPNGTDTVSGAGFTPAAGKGLSFVKALAVPGDYVKLSGATGNWNVDGIAMQNTGGIVRIP